MQTIPQELLDQISGGTTTTVVVSEGSGGWLSDFSSWLSGTFGSGTTSQTALNANTGIRG